ncbi:sugar ABC transporter substrate-binding protein [Rubellimicrobium aerolatum]|uniref:Sugar ABC transporter substrate-binding protein n=1 Tax=Rubellimicrobium aerolatum TaxID=490979 RepID=A0ABW0SH46_9RHOB|nr:sugar ABC transporter substrate-binding protein [Rubellimicrobium aerolatum]MBP1807729.1 simple sugar transport system substrate-binding protein [Rubellimicrobium aerolatum]
MTILKTASAALIATVVATGAFAQDGANIFVIGGKADDPFWSIVKKGAEDAGQIVEAQGGSVTWLGPQNYDNLGPDAADLIRTAIAQDADAIVGPNWVPEAMDEAFQAVTEAGIPLILYNAGGIEAADRLGAMNYVGSDDYLAGKAAGEYFADHGVTNVTCVNTLPGAANLQAQCKGLIDGATGKGGTAQELPLPMSSFGNPTAVAQAVKGHLLESPEVAGLYTIGNVDANSASIAIMQAGAGDRVKLGGFNLDQTILDNIKAGTQLFAIDQQGYLQGFLSVAILNNYVNYGLTVPTRQILTGPGIIDAANVDATLAGVAAGVR